jgi:D-psicose/D-tagatose/L-ribulose 3-epimerase
VKFGVNTFIWRSSFDASSLPLLERIREMGFDGVELPLIGADDLRDKAVQKGVADSGLGCTICSVLPEGLSAISEDRHVRELTREHMLRHIETAAEIGARVIAGPLYSPVGYLPGRRRTEAEWQNAVEFYRSLGPELDGHNVTIAIEPLNRFETYFLNTIADAVELCREINLVRVGILFDTFHTNIEEKNPTEACRTAVPFLKHVHTCENDRGTPGTGHVDWNGLFSVLSDCGYDEWVTIESFGFSLGALSAAASIWRDLAPTPESIAADGIRFLRASSARQERPCASGS